MNNALYLAALNTPKFLDVKTLLTLACVDKETNSIVSNIWKCSKPEFRNLIYVIPGQDNCKHCQNKKRSMTAFGCCMDCAYKHMKLITKTDVVKRYKLKENDIRRLTCHMKRNTYGSYTHFYDLREVFEYALIAYSGPSKLPVKRCASENKALANRKKNLEELFRKLDIDNTTGKSMHVCTEQYLKNGKGGIRSVKAKIERYIQFEDASITFKDIPNGVELFEDYMDSKITLSYLVERINGYRNRKNILIDALKAVGLSLRSDSSLCQQYIENGTGYVDDIVVTMRQMHFLYNKTNYPELMKNSIERYKQYISDIGWIEHEEYRELIQMHIRDVQDDIKKQAVKTYIRNSKTIVPDYMLSFS